MYVTKTYYDDTYIGTTISDTTVFNKLNNRCQDIIIAYTNKLLIDDDSYDELNTYQQTGVKKAICAQIEFIYNIGGYNSINNADDINAGFSLSKFKIDSTRNSENNKKSNYQYFQGIPISPSVNMYLKNTGLLYRGMDVIE